MSSAFEELLARDGCLVYKTRGVSMEPMLRQNRDLVVIQIPSSRIKKYDVVLYKRDNRYILHRVVSVESDHYLIRGDNTYALERVPDSAVLGVLTEFRRKGKQISVKNKGYRLYFRIWNLIYPLRFFYVRCRRLAVRIARKLGILPFLKKLFRKDGGTA